MSKKEKNTSEPHLSTVATVAAVPVVPGIAVVDVGRGVVGPAVVAFPIVAY
jgi:hypothetical protein